MSAEAAPPAPPYAATVHEPRDLGDRVSPHRAGRPFQPGSGPPGFRRNSGHAHGLPIAGTKAGCPPTPAGNRAGSCRPRGAGGSGGGACCPRRWGAAPGRGRWRGTAELVVRRRSRRWRQGLAPDARWQVRRTGGASVFPLAVTMQVSATVAQVSKPAVSPISKSAGAVVFGARAACLDVAGGWTARGFGNPRYSRLGSLRYTEAVRGCARAPGKNEQMV